MGDLENREQSIRDLPPADNTTSDSITTSNADVKHSHVSKSMGGVVSRINAVIFGSRPPRGILQQLLNRKNGTAKTKNPSTSEQGYRDPEIGRETDYTSIDIPSDLSDNWKESVATTRNEPAHDSHEQPASALEEVVVFSEGEESAEEQYDEQPEERESDDESDRLQRVDSDSENEDDGRSETSAYYVDGTDVESDQEADPHRENGDSESDVADEHESDQEEVDDDELVEFTDSEHSVIDDESECEEEADEELVFDCDSNCPSDCDGNHHECSSECGCEVEVDYSDSDDNDEDIDGREEPTKDTEEPIDADIEELSTLHQTLPNLKELTASGLHRRQASLPESSQLLLQSNAVKTAQRAPKPERNNNRLTANKTTATAVNLVDELQSAIDARVRRSASCKDVPQHRKESNSGSRGGDIDGSEREAWRKDRRARLRTLELKREQILDEVRDGTKDRVADAVYAEVSV